MSYTTYRPARFDRNRSGGGNRGQSRGRRVKNFDPSMYVKKAVFQEQEVVAFAPAHSFADFGLEPQLLKNIVSRGYTHPTEIQDIAIPHMLEGKDVIGQANTGTGKTAAFLIPLLNKVALDRDQRVLIIAPTRELAVQIDQELRQFAQQMGIYSSICIGGVSMHGQVRKLQQRPNFVIGTPGRLKDLERQHILKLNFFNNVVLDEVDLMLDMGFIHDIKHLIGLLPHERQSLFFSATLPVKLHEIMHQILRDPIKVSVMSQDTAVNVEQDVIRTQGRGKVEVLHELLQKEDFSKVVVFLRTKHATEKLSHSLANLGVKVAAVHGNKNQNQRQRALDSFKKNYVQVLLATDVASRGLDIDDVTHVINFDLPETLEDYIHRIGRTGRANKKGLALTFVD